MTQNSPSGRGHGLKPSGCAHGYPTANDCPRCGVRATTSLLRPRAMTPTRWHATQTTMGPLPKIVLTLVLVFPIMMCLLGLTVTDEHLGNAFLVVPLWFFAVVAAVVLRFTWDVGHRASKRD